MLVSSKFRSKIKLINNVLKDNVELLDNNRIKSSWENLVIESTKKCVFTKNELVIKDKKEKSEISMPDILSQFKESVSQSWSEFL
jgi:hypothetical protein